MNDAYRRNLTPLDFPNGQAAPVRRHRRRLPPGLIRAAQAAAWCSVGLRTWRSWDAGACVLWSIRTLRLWREWGCPDRHRFEALSNEARNARPR
jgi:hypothetical protein